VHHSLYNTFHNHFYDAAGQKGGEGGKEEQYEGGRQRQAQQAQKGADRWACCLQWFMKFFGLL
jgi:hypothetical protein